MKINPAGSGPRPNFGGVLLPRSLAAELHVPPSAQFDVSGDHANEEERDEAHMEHAVLNAALSRYPAQLTVFELSRAIANDPDHRQEVQLAENAIRGLRRVGLLHRNGEFLLPSQPAIRFDEYNRRWGIV